MISFMLVLGFLMALVSASSTTDTVTCAKGAHLIVARGSLEPEGPGAMGILAEEIIKLIPGSDMEALVYPALYNEYVESQTEGVRTMNSVINNYVKNCPDTDLILMGYSQVSTYRHISKLPLMLMIFREPMSLWTPCAAPAQMASLVLSPSLGTSPTMVRYTQSVHI
jgi:hypothetical protein